MLGPRGGGDQEPKGGRRKATASPTASTRSGSSRRSSGSRTPPLDPVLAEASATDAAGAASAARQPAPRAAAWAAAPRPAAAGAASPAPPPPVPRAPGRQAVAFQELARVEHSPPQMQQQPTVSRARTQQLSRPPPVPAQPRTQRAATGPLAPQTRDDPSHQPAVSSQGRARSDSPQLDEAVAVGDMLFVRGQGGLAELGTAGGFLGHVMLVVEPAYKVVKDSEDGFLYANVWPKSSNCTEIWVCSTVEATRQRAGLHKAEILLHCHAATGRLRLIGEVGHDEVLVSGEAVELWQAPPALHAELNERHCSWLREAVLKDMKRAEADWSWETAIRAVFWSAGGFDRDTNKAELLREMRSCWKNDPICTSIIIQFWQRALEKVARENAKQPGAPGLGADVASLIVQWMPLKCDRCLPGNLLDTLRSHGWTSRTAMSVGPRQALPAPRPEEAGPPVPSEPSAERLDEGPVCFCARHDTGSKRTKVPQAQAYHTNCRSCGVPKLTNYTEFALCHACSWRDLRCQICAAPAAEGAGGSAQIPVPHCGPQEPDARLGAPTADTPTFAPPGADPPPAAPVPPRYCTMHCTSDRRAKQLEVYSARCNSCGNVNETTYKEFALCAECSDKQEMCMICGFHAPEASNYIPPSRAGPAAAQPPKAQTFTVPLNRAPAPPPEETQQVWGPDANIFCDLHSTSSGRPKTAKRSVQCKSCATKCTTTWAPFSHCPACSRHLQRCALCSSQAKKVPGFMPPPAQPVTPLQQWNKDGTPGREPPDQRPQAGRFGDPHGDGAAGLRQPNFGQPAAPGAAGAAETSRVFCARHGTTERRAKIPPVTRDCRHCGQSTTTNYLEHCLCPQCSTTQDLCMLCGCAAVTAPQASPPPKAAGQAMFGDVPGGAAVGAHAGAGADNGVATMMLSVADGARAAGVPAIPPLPVPHQALGGHRSRYCSRHSALEARPKVESRTEECRGCRTEISTNLAEFTLCTSCCERDGRCMVCGAQSQDAAAPAPAAAAAPPPPPPAPMPAMQGHAAQGGGAAGRFDFSVAGETPAPRFCARHCVSERRHKGEARNVRCMGCTLEMLTTYSEFALCYSCSSEKERCTICGSSAPQAGLYAPPRRPGIP